MRRSRLRRSRKMSRIRRKKDRSLHEIFLEEKRLGIVE